MKRILLATAAVLGVIAVAAVTASAMTAKVRVDARATSLGKVLVNARGHTLYLFAPDKRGKSTCYGKCAAYWPPLLVTGKPAAGAGVKASLLGTTKRRDGKRQVTYNGHPLYLYVGDRSAGQTTGEGLNVSGGLWWAVSPAGKAVKQSSSSGGGGGGGGYGGGYGG